MGLTSKRTWTRNFWSVTTTGIRNKWRGTRERTRIQIFWSMTRSGCCCRVALQSVLIEQTSTPEEDKRGSRTIPEFPLLGTSPLLLLHHSSFWELLHFFFLANCVWLLIVEGTWGTSSQIPTPKRSRSDLWERPGWPKPIPGNAANNPAELLKSFRRISSCFPPGRRQEVSVDVARANLTRVTWHPNSTPRWFPSYLLLTLLLYFIFLYFVAFSLRWLDRQHFVVRRLRLVLRFATPTPEDAVPRNTMCNTI